MEFNGRSGGARKLSSERSISLYLCHPWPSDCSVGHTSLTACPSTPLVTALAMTRTPWLVACWPQPATPTISIHWRGGLCGLWRAL
jgi:hypothetical protein